MLKGPRLKTVSYRTLGFPECGMSNASNFTRGFTPAATLKGVTTYWQRNGLLFMLKGSRLKTVSYRTFGFPEYGMANASNFTRGFTPASNPERGNNMWVTKLAFIYVKRAKAKKTNDQPIHPDTRRFICADDLCIASRGNDFNTIEASLTSALSTMTTYYDKNQLRANPSKTLVTGVCFPPKEPRSQTRTECSVERYQTFKHNNTSVSGHPP